MDPYDSPLRSPVVVAISHSQFRTKNPAASVDLGEETAASGLLQATTRRAVSISPLFS